MNRLQALRIARLALRAILPVLTRQVRAGRRLVLATTPVRQVAIAGRRIRLALRTAVLLVAASRAIVLRVAPATVVPAVARSANVTGSNMLRNRKITWQVILTA